ncbi:MAG: glycosyltransferase [Planctomycetota bacterium]|nr:MAG: glycosyltransferase [Planctomycetota bacterium]
MRSIDVICFGGEDWWYHNRGHIDMQLMRRFARMGTALYVNSIVMQKPNLRKGTSEGTSFTKKLIRKSKSIFRGLWKTDAGFWVYSPLSLPVHHIGWLRKLNEIILRLQLRFVMQQLEIHNPIVWVACPAACDVAVGMKKNKLVYQRTDRFEEYPNVDAEIISQYDWKLKAQADLVVYVNRTLYEQEMGQSQKAIYLDHGVDYDLFSSAHKDAKKPEDIALIPRPIAGYFGAVEELKLDTDFLRDIVNLLPDISFVFVGKATAAFSSLGAHKNVWLLGQKPYEQIPHYGKCFDVAIIPWRNSRWTEAANPIKLKEYLALGKQVVSTPAFTELKEYPDVVYQAETTEEFADCIKKALVENNPERVAERRKKVQTSTWDSKAELLLEELFGRNNYFPVSD